jgi:hypothetical protein
VAFKLTKAEDARKSEYESELNQIVGDADDAKTELESKIEDLIREFNEKVVDPLNEKLNEVRGFVEDIKNERQGEFDDKSERWQEGERGEAAQEWIQRYESAESELEEMSQIEVPTLDIQIPDAESILADLPFEMDQ